MFLDDLLKNARHFDQRWLSKMCCFFFFAVIFGAIIEIIQYFLPSRSAEWYDLLSNSVGAFLGIIVIILLKKLFFEKKI